MVNKTKKVRKGGKVLSSGGFGCIFKPALKCKQKNRMDNYVSKLMKKKMQKLSLMMLKNIYLNSKKFQNIPIIF